MIVYPDYIHFKKEPIPTANPNVWENGVVNYPYTTSPGARFEKAQNRFYMTLNQYAIFTLPLKGFKKITIRAEGTSTGRSVSIKVLNVPATEKTFSGFYHAQDFTYDIPADYQKDDVQIIIEALGGSQYWLSLTLS